MTPDDKLDHLYEETFKFHGEVRQYMENTKAYLGAVNTKLNGHLGEHTEDLKKEIENQKKSTRDRVGIAVALFTSAAGAAWQMFTTHRK